MSQTLSADQIEIIVIDNGSTDRTAEIVRTYFNVEILFESSPGSYIARNRGLESARGYYVAFTDADCVPHPNWIAAGLERIQTLDNPGIVGGAIELCGSAATPTALAYEKLFAFRQHINVPAGNCVTANWLSPLNVVHEFGGFDPTLFSGGDWKLSRQIFSSGRDVVFEPSMIVQHPPRGTVSEIIKKRKRIAGGKALGINLSKSLISLVMLELKDVVRKNVHVWHSDYLYGTKVKLSLLLFWIGMVSTLETILVRKGRSAIRY